MTHKNTQSVREELIDQFLGDLSPLLEQADNYCHDHGYETYPAKTLMREKVKSLLSTQAAAILAEMEEAIEEEANDDNADEHGYERILSRAQAIVKKHLL